MPIESYITLFLTLLLLAYKPGPGFFLNVSYGVKEGFIAALTLNIGVAVVCGVYFALSMQLVAFGSALIDSFVILVKGAGSAFLIYMGSRVLQETAPETKLKQVRSRRLHEYFLTGLFLEMGNPISIVFFLTLIPPLMPVEQINAGNIFYISLFVFCCSLTSLGSISLMASIIGKKFVSNKRFFLYLNKTTGVGLIIIGLYIAVSAIQYVLK